MHASLVGECAERTECTPPDLGPATADPLTSAPDGKALKQGQGQYGAMHTSGEFV